MPAPIGLRRTGAVARKEMLHILRDPTTIFFTLFIPVMEMFLLGYAIDTNIKNVRTVVCDESRTQESRRLLERFRNSEAIKFVAVVHNQEEMNRAIIKGEARVGIKIPEDYARRLQAGDKTSFLVAVDGSESSVTGEVVNVANSIALLESLEARGIEVATVNAEPHIMFNPATRSANFFLPGMLVVLCQMASVLLTSTSIVREKENGTIEQLFMTPVGPRELIIGKLAPYLFLAGLQFCILAVVMRLVFDVPFNGPFFVLFAIFQLFVLAMMGLGLAISIKAPTREAAEQAAIGTVIPSIFSSGYIFPLDSMPPFFYYFSFLIPTTWMIDCARAVILRGAEMRDLTTHALVLAGIGIFAILFSSLRFQKHL